MNQQEGADFCSISEYTPPPDVAAARSRFFSRKRRILLYTERTHFYHRHRIRGIKVGQQCRKMILCPCMLLSLTHNSKT